MRESRYQGGTKASMKYGMRQRYSPIAGVFGKDRGRAHSKDSRIHAPMVVGVAIPRLRKISERQVVARQVQQYGRHPT